jgi:Na+/proline symporter
MSIPVIAIAGIAVYLASVTVIGWLGYSLARESDMFNIFGRRAKTIRATASYLGLIGGGELITITQLGHDNGWDVFWFLGGIAIGFVLLGLAAGRMKSVADGRRINTLAGFYADQFGPAAGIASTIIFVLSLGSLLTIQFIVGSQLLAALFHIPVVISILVIGAVIISYLVPAGIVAVLSTDVLRAVMMSIVLVVIVYFTGAHIGSSAPPGSFQPSPAPDNVIYLVLGFFGAIAAADVWQSVLASRDIKVIRTSLFAGAVAFLFIGALLAELGMLTAAAIPHLSADVPAFIVAATRVVPGAFAPLVAVLVTGSVMATADTEIWVISTLLLSNFKPSLAGGETNSVGLIRDSSDLKRITRWLIPLVAISAMVAAYLSANAQAIYTGLLSLLSASGVAMLGSLFLHPKKLSISFSLWAGLLAFVILSLVYTFNIPIIQSLLPLVISAIAYAFGAVMPQRFQREQI